MFSKLTLKTKIIIILVLCVITAGLAIYTGIENKRNVKSIDFKETQENSSDKNKEETKDNSKTSSEIIKSEEDTAKKQQEEKKKMLEAKFQKGYDEFNNKHYEQAVNLENEVINEDNNYYEAYNVRGIALCYSNRYEEGMKSIDKALELKPDFGYAMFNKALAYELYGHYDEALIWYDKAISANGNVIWSYYGKASIYGRKGDVDNSVKNLKVAISMQENVKEVAKEEPDFNNVRDSKEFQELVK